MNRISRDGELQTIISKSGERLVAVDFSNPGCPPCRAIKPWWDSLPSKYPNVVFCQLECSECPETASRHGIRATPTFIFFKRSSEIARIVGANKAQILETIEKHSQNSHFRGKARSLNEDNKQNQSQANRGLSFVKSMLLEMGFPASKITKALEATNNGDIDQCIIYLEKLQNSQQPPEQSQHQTQVAEQKKNENLQQNQETVKSDNAKAEKSDEPRRECTLKLIFQDNTQLIGKFWSTDTLNTVSVYVLENHPESKGKKIGFETTFPKKVITSQDFSLTLSECQLVPRSQLLVVYL